MTALLQAPDKGRRQAKFEEQPGRSSACWRRERRGRQKEPHGMENNGGHKKSLEKQMKPSVSFGHGLDGFGHGLDVYITDTL